MKELRFSVWPVGRKMSGRQEPGRGEDRQSCEQMSVGLGGCWEHLQGFQGRSWSKEVLIEMGRWIETHCEDPGAGLEPSRIQHSSVVSYSVREGKREYREVRRCLTMYR